MAKTLILKLATILSLSLLLLLSLSFPTVLSSPSSSDNDDDDNYGQDYVVDSVFENSQGLMRSRSRFLTTSGKKTIRKGATCDAKKNPHVCNGVSVDKGKGLLYCCKKHCRNVLSDKNNCGHCGRKCALWERCCGGVCTNVWRNRANCGKCNKRCSKGVKCEYGYCGYA